MLSCSVKARNVQLSLKNSRSPTEHGELGSNCLAGFESVEMKTNRILHIALVALYIAATAGCGGEKEMRSPLDPDHTCDRIVASARAGTFNDSIAGEWSVMTGFKLRIKSSGDVLFENYQYDEPFDYLPGKIAGDENGIRLSRMYKDEPDKTVAGIVKNLRCEVLTITGTGQVYVSFDLARSAGHYTIFRYLEGLEADRCLQLEFPSKGIAECE